MSINDERKGKSGMSTETNIAPTIDDLRRARQRGADLGRIESDVLRRLKLPSPKRTASSPLYLLQQLSPELADMLAAWMEGTYPQDTRPGKARKIVHAPFCPRNINVPTYMKSLLKKTDPCVVAVEASSAEVGAALHYICSLFYGLTLPATITLIQDTYAEEEVTFCPGDFLPELALFCMQNRIPLVPLATPPKLVPSEHQYTYNQLLMQAYAEFTRKDAARCELHTLEQRAAGLMEQVFTSGAHLVMEREDLIAQSCYSASRLYDLARFLTAKKFKRGPVLTLYKMKHALDFPPLVQTFWTQPAALPELYSQLDPQPDGTFAMDPLEKDKAPETVAGRSSFTNRLETAVEKFLDGRLNEPIDLHKVDILAADVAEALRNHPLIERAPGVRGTLAARELTQAFGLMQGGITRSTLARAAGIALKHRTRVQQGQDTTLEDILKTLFSRIIFDIPLEPKPKKAATDRKRPLTAEEIADALTGLTDAALRNMESREGIPVDDPAFAEEALKHPMVQQALQDAMDSGAFDNVQQAYQDMLNELEDRNMLQQMDSAQMTLSEDGKNRIQERLEDALSRGEITPEELAERLKASNAMPAPPGLDGDKVKLPPRKETELLAEMMDFQNQAKSDSSSLEDMYIHYTLDEKRGIPVSKDKLDYEKLKVMIHQLEKKGLVQTSGEKKRFTLSHLSLTRLLEGLIRRQESQVLERRAFRREHETDKTEVRRYKRGDVFSDISLRHTVRRVIRKGKTLDDINHTDLRSFEKKPLNQLDIVVCVDISASMKESGKLRYAKMALAELSRAAVEKHDRMGIIAFSNLGEEVVPLTDKLPPLLEATMTLRADQYTNIGNGLSCARKMLLKDQNSNPKYIVLITDGEPNAALSEDSRTEDYHQQVAAFSRSTTMDTKKAMGTHHALQEAAKTSRKHIKISVVYISPEDEADGESERTAREIARIGCGKFHKVKAIERLPLEALATVV